MWRTAHRLLGPAQLHKTGLLSVLDRAWPHHVVPLGACFCASCSAIFWVRNKPMQLLVDAFSGLLQTARRLVILSFCFLFLHAVNTCAPTPPLSINGSVLVNHEAATWDSNCTFTVGSTCRMSCAANATGGYSATCGIDRNWTVTGQCACESSYQASSAWLACQIFL